LLAFGGGALSHPDRPHKKKGKRKKGEQAAAHFRASPFGFRMLVPTISNPPYRTAAPLPTLTASLIILISLEIMAAISSKSCHFVILAANLHPITALSLAWWSSAQDFLEIIKNSSMHTTKNLLKHPIVTTFFNHCFSPTSWSLK
jgi:hypothetical protein